MNVEPVPFDQGHVFHQQPEQSFAFAVGRVRIAPQARKLGGERVHPGTQLLIDYYPVMVALLLIFLLGLLERAQLAIPFSFQRVSHQPVVRVHAHVPALGQFRLITSTLHLLLAQPVHLLQAGLQFLLHRERHLDGNRRHQPDEHFAYGGVNLASRNGCTSEK
jgi:hypothetical protein